MLIRSKSNLTHTSTNHASRSHFIYSFILHILLLAVNRPATNQVTSSPVVTDKLQTTTREPISLEEAFLGELRAKDFDFDWSSSKGVDQIIYDQIVYEESKNILLASLPRADLDNGPNATNRIRTSEQFKPNITVLVSNSSLLSSIEFQGYKVSPGKRYLLLWNSKRKQFRHSFTAKFFLYDIKKELIAILSTRDESQVAAPNDFSSDEGDGSLRFQAAEWFSTETSTGLIESLILIQNNDIFTLHDVTKLVDSRSSLTPDTKGPLPVFSAYVIPRRLTYTGREGVIFNGVPDWLYEEEIMGDTPAFQVSPSSDHLAYMTFNDSRVNIMPITIYGDRVIPRIQLIRYPKVGQPNPKVSVHIVENFAQTKSNLGSRAVSDIRLTLPEDLARDQHYINRISWLTNQKLALIWSSRNQNNSVVVICSMQPDGATPSDRWNCEKNLEMKADNGWLDINDDVVPLNSDDYLALIPKFEGPDVGYFKHIARVSLRKPNSFVFLTRGRREVTSINTVDYKRSLVYYTATPIDKPGQRQLYVADLSGPKSSADTNQSNDGECITCDNYPSECTYNYAKMSPTANYYIYHCSGPSIPRTELRLTIGQKQRNFFENLVNDTRLSKLLGPFDSQSSSLSLANSMVSGDRAGSSLLFTFEDNEKLRDKLTNRKILPSIIRFKVPIHNTNYMARVQLLIPQQLVDNLNSSSLQRAKTGGISLQHANELLAPLRQNGKKFPMVVDVYGGPGSQKVDDRFGVNFGHYLASSEQMIYATIDGRGSGFEGSKRLYELYHRLGTVEIQDQIDTAAQVAGSLWFVDPMRVAIWGWSYGGYAAAMALAKSNKQARGSSSEYRRPNSSGPGENASSVFKCAASVAPVTNWIFYDTAYTERYMSSPWVNEKYDDMDPGDHQLPVSEESDEVRHSPAQDRPVLTANKWTPLNETFNSTHLRPHLTHQLIELLLADRSGADSLIQQSGKPMDLNGRYRKASLLDQVAHIEPDRYLLVHGTADDNVNFQQSIMLMKRLIRKNTMFESRIYPDQDHGIAEKADKLHLGLTLSKFLIKCLG